MDAESEKLCNVKHQAIDEKIMRHEKWLGEHEIKIDTLEKSDATNTTQIKNVCDNLRAVTKALWAVASGIFLLLVGFVIWYIQSL